MLDAIKSLGDYIIQNKELSDEEVFVQRAKLRNVKKVICVVFEQKDDKVIYDSVHLEDYSKSKSVKYLYRTFRHGRYDVTPTTRMASPDKAKKRLLLWFSMYSEKYGENPLIQALNNEISAKKGEIFDKVSEEYNSLSKEEKRNLLFTVAIKKAGEQKYLGDYGIFRDIFKKESLTKFFYKYKVESKGTGVCCLCGKTREVWGFASPFSFYTLDKKGFAPDFLQEDAWKRLPICGDCAISLTVGKEFLDHYLLKSFYGFSFYAIPKFVFGDVHDDVIDDIEYSEREKRYDHCLLCEKDNISELIREKEDLFDLIFMFIKPKQKDFFDIVQYVEGVPPSWIRRLYDAIEKVAFLPFFKEEALQKILGEKWVGDLKKRDSTIGGLVRTFFPSSKYTGVFDKYFLDIVGDILAQRPINRRFLIKAFMREIRNKHLKEKAWQEKMLSLKSLMLLLFLEELKLLR